MRPITQELLKEADLAYIIIKDRRIEKKTLKQFKDDLSVFCKGTDSVCLSIFSLNHLIFFLQGYGEVESGFKYRKPCSSAKKRLQNAKK